MSYSIDERYPERQHLLAKLLEAPPRCTNQPVARIVPDTQPHVARLFPLVCGQGDSV